MKRLHVLLATVLLAASATFPRVVRADEIEIDPDSFAAIAYSPSTGEFHYAYGYEDRWTAEKAALDIFKAKDARAVGWVNEGFIALALGDDKSAWGTGYTYGNGSSSRAAEDTAIAECKKRTTGPHIVLCLSSDGQHFYKPEPRPVQKAGATPAKPQAGGTFIRNADGSSVEIRADGTKIVKNADGSSIETRADGTEIVTNKDGSSEETRPDKTKITKNADGSSIETRADGTEIVTNKDGSSEQTNPDGSKIITDADGKKTVEKADKKAK